jgi:SAM-dependent methyltransferase
VTDPHDLFPTGFFDRADETPDDRFYVPDRFVTHIDDRAIAAVGTLYRHLALTGSVLDIMSSWVSHFLDRPDELVALGMNERELAANAMAHSTVIHDLNIDPTLPFPDGRFDAITCCVSIDYLVRPIDVLRDAARVVKPGGAVVCTFSNRCFPTKVVQGWLRLDDEARVGVVAEYFRLAAGYDEPNMALCTPPNSLGDPLYAVWATVGSHTSPVQRLPDSGGAR